MGGCCVACAYAYATTRKRGLCCGSVGAAELAEVRTLNGGHIFSSIAHVKALPFGAWWGATKTRAMYEATYFAGLRKAGMPEE